jgi:hypothetical protein
MRARTLALVLLGALALTGCGLPGPPAPSATTPTPPASAATTPATGDPQPERGGSIPAGQVTAQSQAAGAQPTPAAALARYAALYVTWTAQTVVAQQRYLAAISTGQARAQALAAASAEQRDRTLAASGVANRGSVIAITPGTGQATGRWVIVTVEQTTGRGSYQGLPASVHVTLATVAGVTGGYAVSAWQPQD